MCNAVYSDGPIGSVIGQIVVAISSGFISRTAVDGLIEKLFEREEEMRNKLEKEALLYFFENAKYDIQRDSKYNEQLLGRTYRRLAIICHPDRQQGNYVDWLRLSAYYGILTAMWEQQKDVNESLKDSISTNHSLSGVCWDRSLSSAAYSHISSDVNEQYFNLPLRHSV